VVLTLPRTNNQRIRRLEYQARQGCFQLTATHHPSPDHLNRFLYLGKAMDVNFSKAIIFTNTPNACLILPRVALSIVMIVAFHIFMGDQVDDTGVILPNPHPGFTR
jgi:hypothetical protein